MLQGAAEVLEEETHGAGGPSCVQGGSVPELASCSSLMLTPTAVTSVTPDGSAPTVVTSVTLLWPWLAGLPAGNAGRFCRKKVRVRAACTSTEPEEARADTSIRSFRGSASSHPREHPRVCCSLGMFAAERWPGAFLCFPSPK